MHRIIFWLLLTQELTFVDYYNVNTPYTGVLKLSKDRRGFLVLNHGDHVIVLTKQHGGQYTGQWVSNGRVMANATYWISYMQISGYYYYWIAHPQQQVLDSYIKK